MIILGTYDFAMGMKLAGIKDCFVIENKEDYEKICDKIEQPLAENPVGAELIIANDKVISILPELENMTNLVVLPDNTDELLESADLKRIIKSAIGVELNI